VGFAFSGTYVYFSSEPRWPILRIRCIIDAALGSALNCSGCGLSQHEPGSLR
jgi:hypothetical protein